MKVRDWLKKLNEIPPDYDIVIINWSKNINPKDDMGEYPTIVNIDIISSKPFTYNTKLTAIERTSPREYYQVTIKAVAPK